MGLDVRTTVTGAGVKELGRLVIGCCAGSSIVSVFIPASTVDTVSVTMVAGWVWPGVLG